IVNYPQDVLPPLDDWRTNWVVGVALTMPIFDGFETYGRVRGAEAELAQARAQLEQTVEAAALDEVDTRVRLEVATSNWRSSTRTTEQAARAYEIAQLRFEQGVS